MTLTALLNTLAPVLSGIIGAIGAILIARWQEEGKSQVFLTEKVDEIVDERVSELRAERDQLRAEMQQAWQERNQLSLQLLSLREEIAVLRNKQKELELHRQQAITRMRHEIKAYSERYLILLTENTELRLKLGMGPHPWADRSRQQGEQG